MRYRYMYENLSCFRSHVNVQRSGSQNPSKACGRTFSPFLQKPQGAPRGLLNYYILHRTSQGPVYGYEISQDIEEKTEGAWRPGAGSVYPTLKKLVAEGLIRESLNVRSRSSEARRSLLREKLTTLERSTSQRTYEITPEGLKCLKEGKEMLSNAGKRWSMMRGIFVDLMDPERVSSFLVEGSKMQFDTSRQIIDSNIPKLSPSEAEFILKEYALNLERQLDWTKTKLSELEKRASVVTRSPVAVPRR
jgi:DNA-binding PadR family transcriptional regulator